MFLIFEKNGEIHYSLKCLCNVVVTLHLALSARNVLLLKEVKVKASRGDKNCFETAYRIYAT